MAFFAAILAAFILSSCHTLKTVAVTTRDSVVLKEKDTTVIKYITIKRDSTIIHDTTIGISGGHSGFTIGSTSTSDTTVKNGGITVRRTVNNGIEHIDCNSDSLTIVVADLIVRNTFLANERDTLAKQVNNSTQVHSEVTIKEKQLSWWGRIWAAVQKYFAWFGLICLVIIIVKLILKFK